MRTRGSFLPVLLLTYMAASLLHFAHEAEFLGDYPNLPAWLTRSDVYFVWIGQAFIGLFAAFGFDGLLHYPRAPFGEHTVAMNFTIWFEVVAAAALLVAVVFAVVKRIVGRDKA
jgi:hypothetical protein